MASLVTHHLRVVIGLYLVAFLFVMYAWNTGGSSSKGVIDTSSLLFRSAVHPHNGLLPERHEHPTENSNMDTNHQQQKSEKEQKFADYLFIGPDADNNNNNNNNNNIEPPHQEPQKENKETGIQQQQQQQQPGGDGERQRAPALFQDRTLMARLRGVFTSILDCPTDLPLTFLGLDNSTADLSQDPACTWTKASVRNVEENFVSLGGEMAVLKDVTLDPTKFKGTPGGEKIDKVFLQNEDSEYFKVQPGFFSLPCASPPKGVKFHVEKENYRHNNHLNGWFASLTCNNSNSNVDDNKVGMLGDMSNGYIPGVTLALQRYEYANIFHTMLDWYNTFLTLLVLGVDPRSATVLLVDGHPWGKLDSTWATMFGGRSVVRAGYLLKATTFQHMVWIPNGYHCPLFEAVRAEVPFMPQLREFFYKSYGVQPSPGPSCSKLRLLLVRRRDYLAHPRNPKGVLQRKIANEDEIRDALIAAFPQHVVTAEQLDLLPMKRQLEIVGQTDILVGMHGAALTYTSLLASGAALVEMYPKYAGRTSRLFKLMAQWRGIHYVNWMNQDKKNEKPNKFTYIPTSVVVGLVTGVKEKMCAGPPT